MKMGIKSSSFWLILIMFFGEYRLHAMELMGEASIREAFGEEAVGSVAKATDRAVSEELLNRATAEGVAEGVGADITKLEETATRLAKEFFDKSKFTAMGDLEKTAYLKEINQQIKEALPKENIRLNSETEQILKETRALPENIVSQLTVPEGSPVQVNAAVEKEVGQFAQEKPLPLTQSREEYAVAKQAYDANPTLENSKALNQAEKNLKRSQAAQQRIEAESAMRKYEVASGRLKMTESELEEFKNLDIKARKLEYRKLKFDNITEEELKNLSPEEQGELNNFNKEVKETNEKLKKYTNKDETITRLKDKEAFQREMKNVRESLEEDVRSAQERYDEAKVEVQAKARWVDRMRTIYTDYTFWRNKALNGFTTVLDAGIMGFAFMLPNFVIGPIEAAMGVASARDTLLNPQKFGGIWMQMPQDLVSDAHRPLSSYNVYVAISVDPQAEKVERNNAADTNEFFKVANYYMAVSDWSDNWAENAITDPNFPGIMVHLNTGFKFYGDGSPVDADNPVVSILQTPQKGLSLQDHLDKDVWKIEHGVSGEAYFESRQQATGYRGNKTIAKQWDKEKNGQVARDYPDLMTDEHYGKILNPLLGKPGVFFSGNYFSSMLVQSFQGSDAIMAGVTGKARAQGAEEKPYPGFGQYIYQTHETPYIKSIKTHLKSTRGSNQDLADTLVDYVIFYEAENPQEPINIPIPFQIPQDQPPYNIASYVVNPKADYMLSLLDGTAYSKDGATAASNLQIEKILQTLPADMVRQISAVKTFADQQLQYGPFAVGGALLTIDPTLQDKEIYVYKNEKALEDGQDDYLVAMTVGKGGPSVGKLPDPEVIAYISLVTSRFYTSSLLPYNKAIGNENNKVFNVYKQNEGTFLVATGNKNEKLGSIIYSDKAPLFSLFMDPEINPNKPNAQQQKALEQAGSQNPKVIPVPEHWALSDRGPVVKGGNMRIDQVLIQEVPNLRKRILTIREKWLPAYAKLTKQEIDTLQGVYKFTTDLLPNIILHAVPEDRHVYTSESYPGDYLVLVKDYKDFSTLGEVFDIAEPQRFAISLSTGDVYDAQQAGKKVYQFSDLENLLTQAQRKGSYSAELLHKINNTQTINVTRIEQEEFGPDNNFGRFKFFIDREDLANQQYIYGDVSEISNPSQMDKKELLSQIKDYFVAIESAADGTLTYGTRLGPKTNQVLSLISGSLFDRGGTFQGYLKQYGESVDKSLDITKGYLDQIYGFLKLTWGKELRPALRQKIEQLTQDRYRTLLSEKAEVEEALQAEEALYKPMNANLLANIDAQPYIPELKNINKYVKKYNNKYYLVSLYPGKSYFDVNIGPSGKDNKQGMLYDENGNSIVLLTGWSLENARASVGIVVSPNGKQELDIAIDHPSIPITDLIALNEAQLTKERAAAQKARDAAVAAIKKSPNSANVKNELMQAAGNLGLLNILLKSAQAVKDIASAKGAKTTFYYNRAIAAYFVKIEGPSDTYYVDLKGGYEFNTDGTPKLKEYPMYQNDKGEFLFAGFDQDDFAIMEFKYKDNTYGSWTQLNEQVTQSGQKMVYTMINVDTFDQVRVIYDTSADTYEVIEVRGVELVSHGVYKPTKNRYSLLSYLRSKEGTEKLTYDATDATAVNPTYLVVDQKGNPTNLFYKLQLVPLKKKGDSYSGEYSYLDPKDNTQKQATITYSREVIHHGSLVEGHYAKIIDRNHEFQFLFDTSLLDPELPSECPAEVNLVEERKLNYWKQCAWKINVVVDAFGKLLIVANMPSAENLKQVSTEQVQGYDLAQRARRGEIIKSNLTGIRYDGGSNRFFYQLAKSRDGNAAYYKDEYEGWYVDLSNGILFNPNRGGYPTRTLRFSELLLILDGLELGVNQQGLIYRGAGTR